MTDGGRRPDEPDEPDGGRPPDEPSAERRPDEPGWAALAGGPTPAEPPVHADTLARAGTSAEPRLAPGTASSPPERGESSAEAAAARRVSERLGPRSEQLRRSSVGLGIALGAGIGAAIGAATGDIAVWTAVGVGVGLALGSTIASSQKGR